MAADGKKKTKSRDEWFGEIQDFLEERIRDAPDGSCAIFARRLWDETAEWEDD